MCKYEILKAYFLPVWQLGGVLDTMKYLFILLKSLWRFTETFIYFWCNQRHVSVKVTNQRKTQCMQMLPHRVTERFAETENELCAMAFTVTRTQPDSKSMGEQPPTWRSARCMMSLRGCSMINSHGSRTKHKNCQTFLSQKLAFSFVPTIILLCHAARMASRTETWFVSLSVQTDIQHLSNCWDSVQCWLAIFGMLQQDWELVCWHADVSIQLEAPVCLRAVNSSCWGLKGPTPS